MRLNKIALRNFTIAIVIGFGVIACDKDFATIDSDIINEDTATNFNTTSEKYEVISFTNRLDPIQTNGLGINMLGVYDDPIYGHTIASVLTQVSNNLVNPTFGVEGTEDEISLDSVVLTIPLFSTNTGISEENSLEYRLDSVFSSNDLNAIKLSIFENNYFLRDFNPNGDFDESQSYFSNKSASINEPITSIDLESTTIAVIDSLVISDEEIILTDGDETEPQITQRLSPRIREVWTKDNSEDEDVIDYWMTKILAQETQSTLSNSNNFNDYFRGLFFKAEPYQNDGSFMILNLAQQDANITLHYSFESPTEEGERNQATYVLTFGPTRVNFFENDYTIPFADGDDVNGDEKLFLKGGEGSVATIKLFNGETNDDDPTTDNVFETWRNEFVTLNSEGEFESAKRLINEANLIFYVNQEDIIGEMANNELPERLYLYNKTNGSPLADYFQDSQNNTLPQISIPNHLGILERDDEGNGFRYKMRITSHINNLLLNNTDNIELGLAVSGNVNLEATVPQYMVQTSTNNDETVPVSSIITPRGTILYGSADSNNEINERLFLEIFYTCLETDSNCPN
ncbi:DUF4270 domain-containing protein [Winogradskyella jejuensis]|uniref:DUF4270 domain-containing protein n=1 Tax=Winogradskyella jejuensis TaxID=1089305 RepID=A0A1M5M464_9FLAO|nr:DUF4270 domain-containing protein [Winogradskyella jejuensis]SHG72065.1 protein of unknown function [Winogradskyella jejuensis]